MSTMLLASDDKVGMVILSNTNVEMHYQPEYLARTLLGHVWNVSNTATYSSLIRSQQFWARVAAGGFAEALLLFAGLLWRKLRQ